MVWILQEAYLRKCYQWALEVDCKEFSLNISSTKLGRFTFVKEDVAENKMYRGFYAYSFDFAAVNYLSS